MKEDNKKRVAFYCRVSPNIVNLEDEFAIETTEIVKCFKLHKEWELVETYMEIANSRISGRTVLRRLLKDCKDNKIDIIVLRGLDRISRNFKDCSSTLNKLKKMEVEVYSLENECITDTSPFSKDILDCNKKN